MCLNCGCNQPSNRHGDARNITHGDLKEATKTRAHRAGTGGGVDAAARVVHRTIRRRKTR